MLNEGMTRFISYILTLWALPTSSTGEISKILDGRVRCCEGAAVQFRLRDGVSQFCPVGGMNLGMDVYHESPATNGCLRDIDESMEVIVGVDSFLKKSRLVSRMWH